MFTMSNRFVVFPASFFFLFYFSLFLFCIYYQFIPVEDLCVDLLLLWISLSFSGGFLAEEFFLFYFFLPLFSSLHWVPVCQKVFLNLSVGLDIPCIICQDGGFIRRDSSFHLPRIEPARAG